MFDGLEQDIGNRSCPNCNSTSLYIEKKLDVIDEFIDLAEGSGADVEIISVESEEGQMLMKSFGGIAAILRFKT
jgi:peptide chain release factor subunit 1